MKKIMFLYHVKERELAIISFISQQITENVANVEIRSGEFYSSILETIQFDPDVIVSIPPRDCYSSNYLTVLKMITGAVVISMNTEGYYVFTPKEIKMVTGYNTYAKELVDYYLMWGPKTRRILGEALWNEGKLTDRRRIKTTGYVWYQKDLVIEGFERHTIYHSMQKWIHQHKKNILVLTGFLVADSSIKDYQILGYFGDDKPLNKRTPLEITQAQKSIEAEREFRRRYIDMIIFLAQNNPDIGFLVKLHPIEIEEKNKSYDELERYPNIFLLKDAIPVGAALNLVDSMVHYNSTCNLEAYIYNIPTIQVYDDSKKTSFEFVWQMKGESTYLVHIKDVQKLNKLIREEAVFKKSRSMEKTLYNLYGWKSGKAYRAIEKSAYYISKAQKPQRLRLRDQEVLHAMNSDQGRKIINMLKQDILLNITDFRKVSKDIFALCKVYIFYYIINFLIKDKMPL